MRTPSHLVSFHFSILLDMLTPLYVPPSLLVLAARGALAQSSSGMTYVDVGPVENPFTFSPSSVQLLPDSLGVTFQL